MNRPDAQRAQPLLLVSGSPRRRDLLHMIGVRFDVYDADINEGRRDGEPPVEYATRLAREKARAGFTADGAARPALGADTIVVVNGDILGKPGSETDARRMLRRLSGRTHEVVTAVAVAAPGRGLHEAVNRTRVSFADLPAGWIERYAASGEPMDKAGAYAIQGGAAQWVSRIEGSFSGVMGLPLFETAALLRAAGYAFDA